MKVVLPLVLFCLAVALIHQQRTSGQTLISPTQLRGSAIAQLYKCSGTTGPMSDCNNFYYVVIRRPDGSTLSVIAETTDLNFPGLDPASWTLIP